MRLEDPCWWCNGSGKRENDRPCPDCNGGYVLNDAGREVLNLLKKYPQ